MILKHRIYKEFRKYSKAMDGEQRKVYYRGALRLLDWIDCFWDIKTNENPDQNTK